MNGIEKTRELYRKNDAELTAKVKATQAEMNNAVENMDIGNVRSLAVTLEYEMRRVLETRHSSQTYEVQIEAIAYLVRSGGEVSYRKIQAAGIASKYGLPQLVAHLVEAGTIKISKTNSQGLEYYTG